MGERIHKNKEDQIEFKVDLDHVLDVATLDETISISEMFQVVNELQVAADHPEQLNVVMILARIPVQLKAGRGLLCKLVWDGEQYLDPVVAADIVGQFSLRQIFDTVTGIFNQINATHTGNADADRASADE